MIVAVLMTWRSMGETSRLLKLRARGGRGSGRALRAGGTRLAPTVVERRPTGFATLSVSPPQKKRERQFVKESEIFLSPFSAFRGGAR